ncbi:MAG: acylneuraminate cytidylyltransferase family protein [FCB group bacterium]|nr:acylneuraminate cytidylyltransferase family protein [FCB group bacterium]
MKILAFIPARGGSKGVPGKNIREFAGKPLIVHSIEQALETPMIDEVVLSTDDRKIAVIAQNAGARVIERPAEISGDTASTESAIAHAISVFKSEDASPDILVLMQATSPLRPPNALTAALEKFILHRFDSLVTLTPTHRFLWGISGEKAVPRYDFMNRPRRQDIKTEDATYVETGSFYIFTRRHFETTGNRLGGEIGYYILPEEYGYEIDTITDFLMLEAIHKNISA